MEFFIISMLNGLSYGLLLFMLSSGLTLIFSMMGVLNFAHASFYMVGAYVGYTVSRLVGFWPALVIAPLVVGALGAVFERLCLRRVHKFGHVPELLITFGLSYVILELVQLIWGRIAVEFRPPELLQGPVFTLINHSAKGLSMVWGAAPAEMCSAADAAVRLVCSPFPATRGFMMLVALVMLVSVWLLLTRTRIGLVIQAALTHPEAVESLGHNVPAVFMMVFGAGAALAGLAGVIGGSTFLTEPSMAATVGSVIFVVVVVGGMGSLSGAFLASVLIGVIQTFAVAFDYSVGSLAAQMGVQLSPGAQGNTLVKLTISQVAPILPYLFLVLILIFRPKGLLGTREG
ncbi:MAG TPA: branched-chain amino acid ABC transporter permease [Burkholderiaceae bacterium]|jgi:branched-chain amino acid transport system permease protein|uniref:branched-chain amino acid ABC transporter permease n=1 Tax=Candidatus Skiveiella danica TaxID=3386177 RepID=UPI0009D56495|nr:branched-chain amino acid ABC transporter permease [Comamonadaceae bacterium]MBK9197124.1 branched-chain amino acid ABC transporter permease [Betaproteobacteria bacterium]MBP6308044.1 branched-chain amino acid ABC transporter permease [Burkholderiaceae bacterium]OQC16880.1 MAG: High-affinity branched-chain amino acid transport system permease protein LivH [Alphaproteobacteria bacterium ADurb.Bin100]MBK6557468.1 branched-chain amino acid ABC transporter permease [Comamonadaceae bacterium]